MKTRTILSAVAAFFFSSIVLLLLVFFLLKSLLFRTIEDTGTVEFVNSRCSTPFLRCSITILSDTDQKRYTIIFDSYQNHRNDFQASCKKWYSIKAPIKLGDKVKFKAIGPYHYSEMDSDNYEICTLNSHDEVQDVYLEKL